MADNTQFQSGTPATPPPGLVVAGDDVGGVLYQRVKIDIGADGASVPLAGTFPLGTLPGGTLALAGSVAGSVWLLGTVTGTVQPLAGSVHLASSLPGTAQVLGTVRVLDPVGTMQTLGTVQPLAGSVHLASRLPGTVDVGTVAGTVQVLGSVATVGTRQVLGTVQPLAGSVHLATGLPGTAQVLGTLQPLAGSVHLASRLPGTVDVGTVAGTVQALGTFQPLAGSVHVANAVSGTVVAYPGTTAAGTYLTVRLTDGANFYAAQGGGTQQILGTVSTSVSVALGTLTEGTINSFTGTAQILGTVSTTVGTLSGGTVQPLPGSVSLIGGTFAPGSVTVLGTAQTLGTVTAYPGTTDAGTYLSVRLTDGASFYAASGGGTQQVLGTVRVLDPVGTMQVLGTTQPLAGSVHLATNLAGGSVLVVGSAAHGATADARPVLVGAFGSSGTQAAVGDGQAVRLWADLNGRLQTRGTVDSVLGTVSIGTIAGTVALGSVRQVFGTIAVGTIAGTVSIGTIAGTIAVGTIRQVFGTLDVGTVAGTVGVLGTIRTLPQLGTALGETTFGTFYTASAAAVTLIAAPATGTAIRIYDIVVSASAAGTVRLLDNADGTFIGAPLFLAANGGWSFTSQRGIRSRGTARAVALSCSTGTWGIFINYALEN